MREEEGPSRARREELGEGITRSDGDSQVPTAPVLTSAVADSATEITITWDASTDNVAVTGYETRIDGGAWADRGDVLTYQYTGLTAATEYDFEVRAYDAAGNFSDPSNLLSETTESIGFTFLGETAKAGSDNNTVLSDPLDTTGAKLIVVALGHYTFTTPTLTDSEGNTWTLFSDHGTAGNSQIKLYYCIDPVTAADHTFGSAVASQYASIAVQAFGAGAVTAEDEAGAFGVADEVATGNVTASENGSLFVAALCSGNAEHDAASVSAGFSTPINGVAAGDIYNVAMSYKIQGTAGVENVTWSVPDSTGLSGCLANFLPE